MRIGIDARKIDDYGIGTYVRGLLAGLDELEADNDLVVFAPSRARHRVPRRFELVAAETPNYTVRELFTIGRAIDRARLDLFHSPHYVVPFTSCPAVVTIHDLILFHFRPRNPLGALYVETMTRRGVAKAARIVTVSEAAKRSIVDELHVDAAKIDVTPNGVDARFTPAANLARERFILFAGNDKPHKNVERLVEAVSIARRRNPSLYLVLAGAPFERFTESDAVDCKSFVSDEALLDLYRRALMVVVPSLEEGFGLPAVEAMACGTPVVTSNTAALVEVTGDAALHADARAPEELAAAIVSIANDAALRDDLARRGIERAAAFTWRRCAAATRAAWRAATMSPAR